MNSRSHSSVGVPMGGSLWEKFAKQFAEIAKVICLVIRLLRTLRPSAFSARNFNIYF